MPKTYRTVLDIFEINNTYSEHNQPLRSRAKCKILDLQKTYVVPVNYSLHKTAVIYRYNNDHFFCCVFSTIRQTIFLRIVA